MGDFFKRNQVLALCSFICVPFLILKKRMLFAGAALSSNVSSTEVMSKVHGDPVLQNLPTTEVGGRKQLAPTLRKLTWQVQSSFSLREWTRDRHQTDINIGPGEALCEDPIPDIKPYTDKYPWKHVLRLNDNLTRCL